MIKELSIAQKVLYFSLLFLIVLMVIFSFKSLELRGVEGYNHCMKQACEVTGEEYCNRFRTVNNCCVGAGGRTIVSEGKNSCFFD